MLEDNTNSLSLFLWLFLAFNYFCCVSYFFDFVFVLNFFQIFQYFCKYFWINFVVGCDVC